MDERTEAEVNKIKKRLGIIKGSRQDKVNKSIYQSDVELLVRVLDRALDEIHHYKQRSENWRMKYAQID